MNARSHSVKILLKVLRNKQSLEHAWTIYCSDRDLGKNESFVRAICFGVLRYYPRLASSIDTLLEKPLRRADEAIYFILLCASYQLLYMRTPAYAVLSEAQQSAMDFNKKWAKGLISAVLRRLLREQDTILQQVDQCDENKYALPAWLLQDLKHYWPQDWQTTAEESLQHPPFCLRVNLARQSRADYIKNYDAHELSVGQCARSAVYLKQACDVAQLVGFKEGKVSVQDEAAQLAAFLLPITQGARVLDACAAPGGKTAAILEQHDESIEVVALDYDPKRAQKITQTLNRLQLTAEVHVADASQPEPQWADESFDAILLDAPCSATGVIRRHPDIKWLRRASDILNLAATQLTLLKALWPLLAESGYLLYATCSILPPENHDVIKIFTETESSAHIIPLKLNSTVAMGHPSPWGLQILPGEAQMDGFFYSLLQKKAKSG